MSLTRLEYLCNVEPVQTVSDSFCQIQHGVTGLVRCFVLFISRTGAKNAKEHHETILFQVIQKIHTAMLSR